MKAMLLYLDLPRCPVFLNTALPFEKLFTDEQNSRCHLFLVALFLLSPSLFLPSFSLFRTPTLCEFSKAQRYNLLIFLCVWLMGCSGWVFEVECIERRSPTPTGVPNGTSFWKRILQKSKDNNFFDPLKLCYDFNR